MAGSDRDETLARTGRVTGQEDPVRRRLAEALRSNLERRKKQKRARIDREVRQDE